MWKFIKWLLIIIAVLIVIFIIAVVVIAKTFDLNKYKSNIEKAFKQQTGRTLAIKGKLKLNFFPNVAIQTGEITVSNPKGYPSTPFATIQSAKFSLAIMPLLTSTIDIKTVSAHGLQLHLIENSLTSNNWNFNKPAAKKSKTASITKGKSTAKTPTTKGKPAAKTPASKTQSSDESSNRDQIENLKLGLLDVDNAQVTYDNKVSGQIIKLSNVSLKAKQAGLNQTFPFTAAFNLTRNKPALKVKANVKASIFISSTLARLSNINAQINDSTVTGTVTIQGAKTSELTANVKLNHMDVAPYLAMADTHIPLKNIVFTTDMILGHNKPVQDIKSLNLTASLAGYEQGTRGYSVKDFKLNLSNVIEGSVFPVKSSFVGQLSDPKLTLKTNITLNAMYNTKKQIARIGQLVAKVNDTTVTGDVSLTGFNKPHITAKLAADKADLADYVKLHGARFLVDKVAIDANVAAQGWGVKQMPSTINGTINATVGNAKIKGFDVGDMLAALRNVFKQLVAKKNVAGAFAQLQQTFPAFGKKTKQINPNNGKETDIGNVTFDSNVKNGVIDNDKLALAGARFQMQGSGEIDLNKKSLDYAINAFGTHYESVNGQQVEVADPVALPIKIKGPFSNIQTGIDLPKLSKSIQKALLKQVQSQVKKSLENKVKEGAGKLLKGLFN